MSETATVLHDPITLEILSNALRSVADETFVALQKSAFSTNIKERHDHSTALFDSSGRLVMQAQKSLPLHVGAMSGTVAKVVEKYGTDIHEGDVFVANDPYAASGTHLPDICISAPIFFDGQLIGFSSSTAHHADIGGASVGGSAAGLTEIFQEGLRIPMIRLFSEGMVNQELFDLLLLNVRRSEERKGDYNAQFAAVALGVKRMQEMCRRYGGPYVAAAFDEIIARTKKRMERAIASIPQGEYAFSDIIDDDGLGNENIPVAVRIIKSADRLTVDFEGSAPQTAGNINSPWADTVATVIYVLKCVLDPHIPSNHGLFATVDVVAPKGSIVRAEFPASVTNRSTTAQRVVDIMIGALAQALPDRVVAASNGANTGIYFYGTDHRTGKPFYFFETMGGGFGARPEKDGKDAVQVHTTNTANTPVEALEREFPLFVEEYSVVENSGGAGRQRGGCGLRRIVRPLGQSCTFGGTGERFNTRPWGLFGGQPGEMGSFAISGDDGSMTRLPNKTPKEPVAPDQTVVMQTAGAGGYGDPAERTPAAVHDDLLDGLFSRAYLEKHYPAQIKSAE
ncbi:hydantoinase B/oxoprolinase family protein [Agrobacterium vitis]|uniref:hydantoinase B/oxoprolinase family protein n=1 Tax=Agrobacterium vitis TaxID=373 RepID=UPI0008FB8487|nr:hydantoinase B/oxoprolinase family protein [Agrobacterium vitis]OHZ39865.1 methylhydantoinase [Agrobacterium vitis]